VKFDHLDPAVKATGDAISIATVVGTLAQILPSIAALLTIVWTLLRIIETDTVQGWLGKKNVKKD
jgi:chromate transport protein ChrA